MTLSLDTGCRVGDVTRLGIYVGFQSSSIINCIEPLTGEVFIARFADCHFNEDVFCHYGEKCNTRFFFQKCRDPNSGSEPEPGSCRLFSFILSRTFFFGHFIL